ncbi:tyrosine-type recombinase/integrase [Shewanella glacialipiscicola]|uniref:Integrase n=1 Tax=Shewanella glacialipiscicola TaxID=614069 RepID=A0ABQ6J2W1_9GAMM|nr:site-specific integrase [Shewanella glacialipiscicola]MCL1084608.1 site-specific integrase [Shewanella glacialipiscicola]GIU11859.1 integrase [Shewanella glacialipiscicola]GMA82453.1 integrase [Shewanella glacialipiscicola]
MNAQNSSNTAPHLHSSISQAIDYYIRHAAQYQKAFVNSEQYRYKRLKTELGSYRLIDLTPELIRSFIDKRLTKVKPSSAKRDVCALQRCWNWYRRDLGMRLDDHFKHVRLPVDNTVREFIPTDFQLKQIIDLLPLHVKPIIELLAETACRRSEILKLTVQDVNLHQRTIYLRNTKNGLDRVVPLSKKACVILNEAINRGKNKLFDIEADHVTRQFRIAADKAGCPLCVVHSLRHYKLSKLISQGIDHVIVAKISGHQDIRMLQRYVKLDASGLAHLMD